MGGELEATTRELNTEFCLVYDLLDLYIPIPFTVVPQPTTAGTSPEPCTGGKSGSGREVVSTRLNALVNQTRYLTFASFSISA